MPKSELETFADNLATEVFTPLYKNTLFWLQRLADSGNSLAYSTYLEEQIAVWTIPDEEAVDLDTDEEIFALMCNKENGGTSQQ